ncbi:MAG: SDR family NAD(P)-dependent oxidoreductase [Myxococcota bacterium]
MKDYGDRVAVITGAASGIGRALALELARRGARLALSDVDGDAVEETARDCRRLDAEAWATTLDVRDREPVRAWADQVEARFGGVDLVVNNAGVSLTADALNQSRDDLDWVMDVDFWGVVNGTEAFLPKLIASGGGHVVQLSSLFGLLAAPSQSGYNAAKFAVRGYSESLAMEMALYGYPVRISCVHPGGIATNIVHNARIGDGHDPALILEMFHRVARTSPERAARTILRGVEKGRSRILVGADAWALHLLQSVLGSRYQRLLVTRMRRHLGPLAATREEM